MQSPARSRGLYVSWRSVVVAVAAVAAVVLAGALCVTERLGGGVNLSGRSTNHTPRLAQALGELVEEARGLATGRGVYTEVGSRERIDRLEQSASERRAGGRRGRGPSAPGMSVCGQDGDCHHPRGVCDVSTGACRCVMAYAGVRCDRVVHVEFPGSGAYGKMLPLDVLDGRELELYGDWDEADEEEDEDEEEEENSSRVHQVERVEERCVVGASAGAAAMRERGVGREIARRLVERFWAREFQDEGNALRIKQKEDARGDVVVLLEAMRRCLEVEVEVEARTPRGRAGRLVGDEVLGWLMARLEVV